MHTSPSCRNSGRRRGGVSTAPQRAPLGNVAGSNVLTYAFEAWPGEVGMTQYAKGTVLTCGHEDCGCRVHIDEECHCPSGDGVYTCACGAPLVELSDAGAATA
jgi:metallothionein